MMLTQAAEALKAPIHGENVLFNGCSTDTRTLKAGELFIALKGERFDGHNFISTAEQTGAAAVMLEQNIKTTLPSIVVSDTKKAMGQLAKSWREKFGIPVVAITGSNGKTTVKEMLTSILMQKTNVLSTPGNLNNDIGVPLTLFGLDKEHHYAVIEMGANHPGEIRLLTDLVQPDVAVITQCAPAHLEGFGSIEGVAKAKSEIYDGLSEKGIAVINADDEYAEYWKDMTHSQKQILFAIQNPADIYACKIVSKLDTHACEFQLVCKQGVIEIHLNVVGQHNVMNALAATSCALALNIDLETIRDGLESFQGVKGRLQVKTGGSGSTIIDDTYNANPASLNAAIQFLVSRGKDTCLILGEMGELGADSARIHYQAGEYARQQGVRKLYTLGAMAEEVVNGFGAGGEHFSEKDKLITSVKSRTSKETIVLVKGSRAMQMEKIVEALLDQGCESC